MTRQILLDTETTGLEPFAGDRIIEIAAIVLVNLVPTGRVFHTPDTLLATLAAEVRRHTGGGTTDDMAMLAVRRP